MADDSFQGPLYNFGGLKISCIVTISGDKWTVRIGYPVGRDKPTEPYLVRRQFPGCLLLLRRKRCSCRNSFSHRHLSPVSKENQILKWDIQKSCQQSLRKVSTPKTSVHESFQVYLKVMFMVSEHLAYQSDHARPSWIKKRIKRGKGRENRSLIAFKKLEEI